MGIFNFLKRKLQKKDTLESEKEPTQENTWKSEKETVNINDWENKEYATTTNAQANKKETTQKNAWGNKANTIRANAWESKRNTVQENAWGSKKSSVKTNGWGGGAPISVNIGLDFGTSFTKAAFTAQGQTKSVFITFDNCKQPYLLPSVVYYNKETNEVSMKESSGATKVKYFKYTAISKALPTVKTQTKTKSSILFCVYYIACVINIVKDFVRNYYKTSSKRQIDEDAWVVTMGVPIENYKDKNNKCYDNTLLAADKFSSYHKNVATMDALDAVYNSVKGKKLSSSGLLYTIPELYAESLTFLNSNNTTEGIYALLDIGGGTMDIGFFMKVHQSSDSDKIDYIAKAIEPLGVEVVANKIYSSNIVMCKKYLKDPYKNSLEINTDDNAMLKNEIAEVFRRLVIAIKDNLDIRHMLERTQGDLNIIFCGGGGTLRWYQDAILRGLSPLKNAFVFTEGKYSWTKTSHSLSFNIIKTSELFDFEDGVSESLKRRLLIAASLSQDVINTPQIAGFPWEFGSNKVQEKKKVTESAPLNDYDQVG